MIAFTNPSAMLRWLEMPEGQLFLGYVEELLELSQARLEKAIEPHEVYRRQGRIDALKDVLNMPEAFREQIMRGVEQHGVVR